MMKIISNLHLACLKIAANLNMNQRKICYSNQTDYCR